MLAFTAATPVLRARRPQWAAACGQRGWRRVVAAVATRVSVSVPDVSPGAAAGVLTRFARGAERGQGVVRCGVVRGARGLVVVTVFEGEVGDIGGVGDVGEVGVVGRVEEMGVVWPELHLWGREGVGELEGGLEGEPEEAEGDAVVLIARGVGVDVDVCVEYVKGLWETGECVRGGVFKSGKGVVIMTVHERDGEGGALFDVELDGGEWVVERFVSVWPGLEGWRMGISVDEVGQKSVLDVESGFLGATGEDKDYESRQYDPKLRLLQGVGAIDGLVIRLREVAEVPSGVLRVFAVSGWNEARIQPAVIELDASLTAEQAVFKVGLNVRSANASVDKLVAGVRAFREIGAHVVLGFGGGAVLDMAKAIAALAARDDIEVATAIAGIRNAAMLGVSAHVVELAGPVMPVVCIPGTIGSGAEVSERCILVARGPGGYPHRLSVEFRVVSGGMRTPREKLAIVDPRIVSPRRLAGKDSAQGALMTCCFAIESLLAHSRVPQAAKLAEAALHSTAPQVLPALREPSHADGASRDPLVAGCTNATLARESTGLGTATMLTLALIDRLTDRPSTGCFRQILVRVTAAVVRECVMSAPAPAVLAARSAARIVFGDPFAELSTADLAEWLEQRAEDAGVPLLRSLGLTSARARAAAQAVADMAAGDADAGATAMTAGRAASSPGPAFETVEILTRIVERAMAQTYEL